MAQKNDVEEENVASSEEIPVPVQIQQFAALLGEEMHGNFTAYVYRVVRDEETGKVKRPFVKKYVGIEPDPLEIAEKFRAGTYAIQFMWKSKNKSDKGNKSFTLDVDEGAFPPLPKGNQSLSPYIQPGNGMSEGVALQLAMIHEMSDVMKEAYKSGSATGGGRDDNRGDPMEMMSNMMEQMETAFSRSMAIQQKIMERVMVRRMETAYGLAEEVPQNALPAPADEPGLIGKYAPVVREIVDGLKQAMNLFGDKLPKNVVKNVQSSERFQELLKDKKALVVIGQSLRREFGDKRAGDLMRTFGVQMVIKRTEPVSKTPDIPLPKPQGLAKEVKEAVSVGADVKPVLKGKKNGKVLK